MTGGDLLCCRTGRRQRDREVRRLAVAADYARNATARTAAEEAAENARQAR